MNDVILWLLIIALVAATAIYLIAQYLDWRATERHERDVQARIDALAPLSDEQWNVRR